MPMVRMTRAIGPFCRAKTCSMKARPSTSCHWPWRWLPASACPWAFCDGFGCASRCLPRAPRSWPSDRPFRPRRRWRCCACRRDFPTAPRRGAKRPSPPRSGSSRGRGRCRYGSCSQRRGSPAHACRLAPSDIGRAKLRLKYDLAVERWAATDRAASPTPRERRRMRGSR